MVDLSVVAPPAPLVVAPSVVDLSLVEPPILAPLVEVGPLGILVELVPASSSLERVEEGSEPDGTESEVSDVVVPPMPVFPLVATVVGIVAEGVPCWLLLLVLRVSVASVDGTDAVDTVPKPLADVEPVELPPADVDVDSDPVKLSVELSVKPGPPDAPWADEVVELPACPVEVGEELPPEPLRGG